MRRDGYRIIVGSALSSWLAPLSVERQLWSACSHLDREARAERLPGHTSILLTPPAGVAPVLDGLTREIVVDAVEDAFEALEELELLAAEVALTGTSSETDPLVNFWSPYMTSLDSSRHSRCSTTRRTRWSGHGRRATPTSTLLASHCVLQDSPPPQTPAHDGRLVETGRTQRTALLSSRPIRAGAIDLLLLCPARGGARRSTAGALTGDRRERATDDWGRTFWDGRPSHHPPARRGWCPK